MATKKKVQRPLTYFQQVLENEQHRHANRMKRIKEMETKLRMFEPFVQQLEAKGIRLTAGDSVYVSDGALCVSSGYAFTGGDKKLYDALIDLGFVEVKRHDYTTWVNVHLKHGRLTCSVHVPPGYGLPKTGEQATDVTPTAESPRRDETSS